MTTVGGCAQMRGQARLFMDVRTQQTIMAMKQASAFVLAHWGDGDFARCFDASTAGAEALRRLGVPSATAKPVVLIAQHPEAEKQISIGLSYEQVYERIDWTGQERQPFSSWRKGVAMLSDDEMERPHAAITVEAEDGLTLLDLTAGQIRAKGFDVPLAPMPIT